MTVFYNICEACVKDSNCRAIQKILTKAQDQSIVYYLPSEDYPSIMVHVRETLAKVGNFYLLTVFEKIQDHEYQMAHQISRSSRYLSWAAQTEARWFEEKFNVKSGAFIARLDCSRSSFLQQFWAIAR